MVVRRKELRLVKQQLNPILYGERHIYTPLLVKFKRKIILPWCNLNLPKNALRINLQKMECLG